MGAQHCPLGLHPPSGLRAAGLVGGRPRGGWPATVARGVWCQALSLPWPPVFLSGQPGLRDPCVPGAVGAGVGTQPLPHSVRPCRPALLAVGVAGGVPGWGALRRCKGRLWSGAPPPPTARPLGLLLGSVTDMLWARVCGCGGPTVSPWPACPVALCPRTTGPTLGGVVDKVVGPNDPPVKKTREHSAAKQLWPNRDVTTRFPARAWRGRAHRWRAQRRCR